MIRRLLLVGALAVLAVLLGTVIGIVQALGILWLLAL